MIISSGKIGLHSASDQDDTVCFVRPLLDLHEMDVESSVLIMATIRLGDQGSHD